MATTGDRLESLPEVIWAQGFAHAATRISWVVQPWRRPDEQLPPGRYVLRNVETGDEYPMVIRAREEL